MLASLPTDVAPQNPGEQFPWTGIVREVQYVTGPHQTLSLNVLSGIGNLRESPAEPNANNPTTETIGGISSFSIEFALPHPGSVRLSVYDLTGALVKTLVDGELPAGYHQVQWDGRNHACEPVTTGVYFYRLKATSGKGNADVVMTRKMNLVR